MGLFDTINEEIKKAMLAKEQDKLEAIRAIKAAFILAKTEKGSDGTLTPEAELKILQKMVKQRKESAEIYISQGRKDLHDKEMFEAGVIEQYLPKQMSDEELTAKLKEITARLGVSNPAELGKVMGVATKELAGKADGKKISEIVRKLLS